MKLSQNQVEDLEHALLDRYPYVSYFIRQNTYRSNEWWQMWHKLIEEFPHSSDQRFEYNLFVILFILESEGELL